MQGMDIHNVEAVIVNGPPDTLAQLYQVITYILQGIKYSNFSMQMFGKAGRGGGPAWHINITPISRQ